MMLHCQTPTHPLVHDGTQQRERLLQSLIPSNLRLDDRSIADIIAFAGELSKQLRFWNDGNEHDGNWVRFWESDTTTLLAIMAATDLDLLRTTYRSMELEYLRLKDREDKGLAIEAGQSSKEALALLVTDQEYGIYGLAKTILGLCQKAPADHPIKNTIAGVIRAKLQAPLKKLIQFHKALDKNSFTKYNAFIGTDTCTDPWGLPQESDFKCLDYVFPYGQYETLWKLYLQFFQSLKVIVNQTQKALRAALRMRNNHLPHVTLFITFLHLFRYLQDDLNGLVDKHLTYYYRDILRLQTRRLIPDKVHVVFQIAEDIERYRIQRGTILLGGEDSTGISRQYALEDELVANRAQLVHKSNLYFNQEEKLTIALAAADKRDGIEEDYPESTKAWHPLSGRPVYTRFENKRRYLERLIDPAIIGENNPYLEELQLQIEEVQTKLTAISLKEGFEVHSLEFVMLPNRERYILLEFLGLELPAFLSLVGFYNVEFSIGGEFMELLIDPTNPSALQEIVSLQDIDNLNLAASNGTGRVVYGVETITEDDPNTPNTFIYKAIISLASDLEIQAPDTEQPPVLRFVKRAVWSTEDILERLQLDPDGESPPDEQDVANYDQPISFTEISCSSASLGPVRRPRTPLGGASGTISGTVTDVNGQPLIGASILVVGTSNGTVTDIDGTYSLTIPAGGAQFEVSYTGFYTQKLAITSSQIDIVLFRASPLPGSAPGYYGSPTLYRFIDNSLQAGEEVIFFAGSNNAVAYLQVPELLLKTFSAGTLSVFIDHPDITILGFDDQAIRFEAFRVNDTEPIEIKTSDITYRYYSTPKQVRLNEDLPDRIAYRNALGQWAVNQSQGDIVRVEPYIPKPELHRPITLSNLQATVEPFEVPDGNGNLFLGFENLQPSQTLSLLFKMAEGTGNADHFAPDVRWAYLKGNLWQQFPPQFILKDETLGLKQTGIIRFQIPADINSGNSRVLEADERSNLFWLSVSADEVASELKYVDALPKLEDIHVHAATAVFQDDDNDLQHVEPGLPAETIGNLRFRDVNVDSVEQPYSSFGGRLPEGADRLAYYRRIHERLRHKNRAVNIWDYERLALEAFPKLSIAKGLSHSQRLAMARPGHVTLVVMPFPQKMIGKEIFYPTVNAGTLEKIKHHLAKRANYFVSGYGHPAFCCCEDDNCSCEPNDHLAVINPRYEPVRLKVCVRFREGLDPLFYTKELNEALKSFLAPWATHEKKPILFGSTISTTQLLQFLENLDYVDVVVGLAVKHFAKRTDTEQNELDLPWSTPEEIIPFTSASLLTTYLDLFNEDNPNVIDHEINVITQHDPCTCAQCIEAKDDVVELAPDTNPPIVPDIMILDNDRLSGRIAAEPDRVTVHLDPDQISGAAIEETDENTIVLTIPDEITWTYTKDTGLIQAQISSPAPLTEREYQLEYEIRERHTDLSARAVIKIIKPAFDFSSETQKILQLAKEHWQNGGTNRTKRLLRAEFKKQKDEGILIASEPYTITNGEKVGNQIGSLNITLNFNDGGETLSKTYNLPNPKITP